VSRRVAHLVTLRWQNARPVTAIASKRLSEQLLHRLLIAALRMSRIHKALFLCISAALCVSGTISILTKEHTSSSRYMGISTVVGDAAIWHGQTCFILAGLPACVLLPRRLVGYAIATWWVVLMAWLFVPFFLGR